MKSLKSYLTVIKNKLDNLKTFIKQTIQKSKFHHVKKNEEDKSSFANTLNHQDKLTRPHIAKTKVKKIRFNYSTELIPQLLGGHQEILRQMSLVDNDAYEKNSRSAHENLQELIHLLDAQIRLEKSRLYPYLQKTLTDNIDAYTTMRNLRKKTDVLVHQIAIMEKKYNQMRNNPSLIDQLESDNSKLSMLLVENFREVETQLYPLYQPGN